MPDHTAAERIYCPAGRERGSNMKRKGFGKWTGLTAILLAGGLLLAGCTGQDQESADTGYTENGAVTGEAAYDSGYDTYDVEDGYDMEVDSAAVESAADTTAAGADTAASTEDISSYEQKMITTWNLSMETEKYDEAMQQLQKSLEKAGGYIESQSESTDVSGIRSNDLTLRIPQEQAKDWVSGISDYGTITSKQQNQEDVTLEYVDMESRLKALRTEQESLLKLMEEAESVEDVIYIQSQLTDVNYEIESYESRLRVMDNQVSYDTVTLYLTEVSKETVVDDSIGAQISETFNNSLAGFAGFFTALVVGFAGNIILWAIVAAIVVIAVIWIRREMKKQKNREQERRKALQEEEQQYAAQAVGYENMAAAGEGNAQDPVEDYNKN